MKILGRILFGLVVMFFGLSLFQCTQQSSFVKAVGYEVDKAVKNDEYSFFGRIFPNAKEDIVLDEDLSVGETTLNLKTYLVGSKDNSTLMFLVTNYSKADRPKTLSLFIEGSYKEHRFDLVNLGKENWYLQWVNIDRLYQGQLLPEDIIDVKIKDGDVVLYDYDESIQPFMRVNEAYIQSYIRKQNTAISHVMALKPLSDVVLDHKVSEQKASETYSQTFRVGLKEASDKEVYVIGNFNGYDPADKTYKLTKKKDGTYEGKFDITTTDKELYYYVMVGEDVSSGDTAILYEKTYVNAQLDLQTLNITTVKPMKLDRYQYEIWIMLLVYLAISGVVMWLLFFRKKKSRAQFAQTPVKEVKPQPFENLNLKAIQDVSERDEDLQVHEKETVIEDEIIEEEIEEIDS